MFVGSVYTEWVSEPNVMLLLQPFGFIDSAGKHWTAPAGLRTDGASIPQVLWAIEGNPFGGRYRRAAVLHDAHCRSRNEPARAVHRMFYEAMIEDGVDPDTATRFYAAVRLFGPTWAPPGARSFLLGAPLPPDFDQVEASLDAVLNNQ